jgi:hypothetical protein
MVELAVDFHERLRFPRGDCGASSAAPAGSPQIAISRRSLRLSFQSTAGNSIYQNGFKLIPIENILITELEWIVAEGT